MDIIYNIRFITDWHCGSGLAAGADLDALTVKDSEGFPFVPGKTIKGLLREAVETIASLRNEEIDSGRLFGPDESSCEYMPVSDKTHFSNAELPSAVKQVLKESVPDKEREYSVKEYLYRKISSTRIDENGIAADHSLRRIEVAMPCVLEGCIKNVPEDMKGIVADGFKFIKRIGLNRTRGLGRCEITLKTE